MLRPDIFRPTRDSASSLAEVGPPVLAGAADAGAFCDPWASSLPDASSEGADGKAKLGLERRESL
jgi:hypothetical protein